jgi:uncharacterized protein (DUF608 family)
MSEALIRWNALTANAFLWLGAAVAMFPAAEAADGQARLNRPPSALDLPADNPDAAIARLLKGSEGKTPTVKRFDPAWVRSLGQRGEPTVYTKGNSGSFFSIGMPVGGIGVGELRLSGDGKLWFWDIFNTRTVDFFEMEQGHAFLAPHTPGVGDRFSDVLAQGMVLQVTADGKTSARTIDKEGFAEVKFRGQYPIGYVDFSDPACPVRVALEAFSPFVPGSVAESSYPATILNYTLTNTSNRPVECVIGGWLENGVGWKSRRDLKVQLKNTVVKTASYTALNCAAWQVLRGVKPPEVYEDFESGTYDKWTVEGTAFGDTPVKLGSVPRSIAIPPDNQGRYYIDTYINDSNDARGKLTSKPFTITRPYITFLIGGGRHPGVEGIRLLVDGAVVRSATGRTTRYLRPEFWDVRDLRGKTAQFQVMDESAGGWGFTQLDYICFADTSRYFDKEPDYGTMTLALLGDPSHAEGIAALGSRQFSDAVLTSPPGDLAETAASVASPKLVGGLRRRFNLKPGGRATVRWIVAWNFPNPTGMPVNSPSGRAYGERFKTAQEVAGHLCADFDRLAGTTRLWHDTYYDSTLPWWFLERTFLNVSTLASSTCFLLDGGTFYANEGAYSCPGTCTHVWSYQQAMGLLFPEIEKRLAEQVALNDRDGAMGADGGIRTRETGGRPAVDGQAGVILRIYLADRMSPDHCFLTRNYAGVKKAMNYLIKAHDAHGNGILEGAQDNTLDAAWFGKTAWLSLYYQAALRAMAEMADAMNDADYAKELRGMADRGRRYVEKKLYDGEYFIQDMDDRKHPDSPGSYNGCFIDQLMGQCWAYHLGIGPIVDPAKARSAVDAIWRYNYTADVAPYRKAYPKGRRFALDGEGGVLMGTFPKGPSENALNKGYGLYFNECWAGSEHLLASLMLWQGLTDKALAVERTIRDRYDATKHNPWDEVECGSHYARSLSSYGVFTAACGFQYNGPKGTLAFAPRLSPDRFAAAFTTADGWGRFSQHYDAESFCAAIELRHGRLRLKTLSLAQPPRFKDKNVMVTVDGNPSSARVQPAEGHWGVQFTLELVLGAGQKLTIQTR